MLTFVRNAINTKKLSLNFEQIFFVLRYLNDNLIKNQQINKKNCHKRVLNWFILYI